MATARMLQILIFHFCISLSSLLDCHVIIVFQARDYCGEFDGRDIYCDDGNFD